MRGAIASRTAHATSAREGGAKRVREEASVSEFDLVVEVIVWASIFGMAYLGFKWAFNA